MALENPSQSGFRRIVVAVSDDVGSGLTLSVWKAPSRAVTVFPSWKSSSVAPYSNLTVISVLLPGCTFCHRNKSRNRHKEIQVPVGTSTGVIPRKYQCLSARIRLVVPVGPLTPPSSIENPLVTLALICHPSLFLLSLSIKRHSRCLPGCLAAWQPFAHLGTHTSPIPLRPSLPQ